MDQNIKGYRKGARVMAKFSPQDGGVHHGVVCAIPTPPTLTPNSSVSHACFRYFLLRYHILSDNISRYEYHLVCLWQVVGITLGPNPWKVHFDDGECREFPTSHHARSASLDRPILMRTNTHW